MRIEQEMYNLILGTAKKDDRVRAVVLNGSRTNPNAVKDIFQDYDILYIVNETKSFQEDRAWIRRFGECLYMQYPEEHGAYPGDTKSCYGWLMQFSDGNRLDLHVCTLDYLLKDIKEEKLCKILLDKDKCLPDIQEATDEAHWVMRPKEKQYQDVCNEFWWCLNNVAKGLWREEIPYVMDMINHVIRPQLVSLLSWKIGLKTDFKISIGKSGKYMYRWLSDEEWNRFLKTYPAGRVDHIWESVFIMCDLFDEVAIELAEKMNYNYNRIEAGNSLKFLKDVKVLPKDAKEIY